MTWTDIAEAVDEARRHGVPASSQMREWPKTVGPEALRRCVAAWATEVEHMENEIDILKARCRGELGPTGAAYDYARSPFEERFIREMRDYVERRDV